MPRLTRWVVVIAVTLMADALGSAAGTSPPATEEPHSTDGAALLQSAMVRMANTAMTARVRQSGGLLGQSLVGSGSYAQGIAEDGELLTRLQMDCQFDAQPGSYLQVRHGAFLWTHRRVGDEETLSRVDVRRVMRELNRQGRVGDRQSGQINRLGATLSGGIPAMLAAMLEQFQFAAPTASQYRDSKVYELVGTPRKVPPPVFTPSQVRVVLGRDDLVPYAIIYTHSPPDVDYVEAGELRTEFYEVAFAAPDDVHHFRFHWDGHKFNDVTPAMVDRLRWVTQ